MNTDDIRKHLEALKHYAARPAATVTDTADARMKKTQLQAIERTIRQLEKACVPVPESLKAERSALVSAVEGLQQSAGGCVQVYEELLTVVAALGRACNRRPHHELYLLAKKRREEITQPDVFRKTIIAVLKELRGAAHQRDVMAKVSERLGDSFTDGDLDCPNGKAAMWQQTVLRERRRMIEDGVLTVDSHSTWELVRV
jgi:hypothetical protein